MPEPGAETSDDAFLGGRLRILQPRAGHHRAGMDAVLLAAACPAAPGESVADLGAGVGVAGLCVAARVGLSRLLLVDLDEAALALARENAARNGLSDIAEAVALDVTAAPKARRSAGIEPESVDHVILNPPFRDAARDRVSPREGRARAHLARRGDLAAWLETAVSTVRQKGSLSLIHTPEAIGHILAAFEGRVGGVAILPVQAEPGRAALRVIVSGRRGSKGRLRLLPPLVLADAHGVPNPAADAVLRGGAALALEAAKPLPHRPLEAI